MIVAAQPAGPALHLLEEVALQLPLEEWLKRLESEVVKAFKQLLREASKACNQDIVFRYCIILYNTIYKSNYII